MAYITIHRNRCVYLFFVVTVFLSSADGVSSAEDPSVSSASSSIQNSSSAVLENSSTMVGNENVTKAVEDIFNSIPFNGSTSASLTTSPESTLLEDSENSVSRSIGNMLISLAFVIMVGLGIAWFMRRYVVKDTNLGGGKIKVIASYALSQKSKVHLIQVGQQTFLVGEGANELNMLSEVNPTTSEYGQMETMASTGTDDAAETTHNGGFEEKLNQWTSALKSKDMQSEVNTSLLLLGGLAQRLRNKREGM